MNGVRIIYNIVTTYSTGLQDDIMKLCQDKVQQFTADMNLDGTVTFSDFLLWIKWIYFLPGNSFAYLIFCEAPPQIYIVPFRALYGIIEGARVSPAILDLGVSIIFSFLSWGLLIAAVYFIPKDIKERIVMRKEKKY